MVRRRRRYKRKKKNALDYIALPRIDLSPETKKGIFIIFVFIFGAICLLGLLDLAGTLGTYLAGLQALAFGWGKWLFPIILISLGWFMYNDDKYYIKGTNYLGLFIFLIVFEALLHYFISFNEWQEMAAEGIGGGFFGYYIALGFHNILGFWGSLLTLLALLVVSLMLLLDTTLSKLIGSESIIAKIIYPFKILFIKMFSSGKKKENNEEDEEEDEEFADHEEENLMTKAEEVETISSAGIEFSKKTVADEPEFMKEETPKAKIKKENKEDEKNWKQSNLKIDLPIDLLNENKGKPTSGDIKNNALIIQRTLENFGIMVDMGEVSVGPTVTQYTFKPAEGVKLSRITTLNNDLALALASHPIRIEAPIPGKALVGIEVPNQTKAIVGLREIINSVKFKTSGNNLDIALGKDVSGECWNYDITRMPHLLVAGATNSGKSVCLNSLIVSLLYKNNPDDLRFIMVDPKRVELPIYNGIPHLLTPVITDVPKTINALKWCLNEMDRRFETLSKSGKRNIQAYNKVTKNEKMPYLVFIIDELADLMVAASKDIETNVIRLAQMARAVGIHLILATQRPSVDVITGLIKANMPARVAFSVASAVDSKTILDSLGAEKLLGQGDMLFMTAEISKPKRIQGAFVSDNEIRKICNYLREKGGEPNYLEGIVEKQKVSGVAGVGLNDDMEEDDLLGEAKEIVLDTGKASASFFQRRLRVGYARAASILDQLEILGVVGPSNGAKPREILISKEDNASLEKMGTSGVNLHNREEAKAPESYLDNTNENEDEPLETAEKVEDVENKDEENEDEPQEVQNNTPPLTRVEQAEDAEIKDEEKEKNEENLEKKKSVKYKKDSGDEAEDKKSEAIEEDDEEDEEGMFFSK
jgi:S-DNA-T family DNA segregation ATPase FtsK/SpoIIIE